VMELEQQSAPYVKFHFYFQKENVFHANKIVWLVNLTMVKFSIPHLFAAEKVVSMGTLINHQQIFA
jgi:hypothetical protein